MIAAACATEAEVLAEATAWLRSKHDPSQTWPVRAVAVRQMFQAERPNLADRLAVSQVYALADAVFGPRVRGRWRGVLL